MRALRKSHGATLGEVAKALGVAPSTVLRWETGERTLKVPHIARYGSAIGATPEQIDAIKRLAWETSKQYLPKRRKIVTLLEIERNAQMITTVSALLIPGLLQTGDYVRAMLRQDNAADDEIGGMVAVRLGRKDAINRLGAARLVAIVGEAALHLMIGGPDVMAHQLRELLQMSSRANVEIRILPFAAGWSPAIQEGPFSLVEFADKPPVVQVDHSKQSLFFEDTNDVSSFIRIVSQILSAAIDSAPSAKLIADRIEQLEIYSGRYRSEHPH
ncbi:hypothetical protein Acsp05_64370 [Actinokineospora sp. NBRC 105648]|nr:hypothetical protein Acsp05_64370 [Actinokineospora sp. NBRC 105648]